MGYELNRLMRQYGVSSPTRPAYVGSTDQDRTNYDAYVAEYNNRLNTTPMYGLQQYQTSLSPALPAARDPLRLPVYQTTTTTGTGTGTTGGTTGGTTTGGTTTGGTTTGGTTTGGTTTGSGGDRGPGTGSNYIQNGHMIQVNGETFVWSSALGRYVPLDDFTATGTNTGTTTGTNTGTTTGTTTGTNTTGTGGTGTYDSTLNIMGGGSGGAGGGNRDGGNYGNNTNLLNVNTTGTGTYNPSLNIVSGDSDSGNLYSGNYGDSTNSLGEMLVDSVYNPNINVTYNPATYNTQTYPDYSYVGGGGRSEFGTQTNEYNMGGPVKKFAVGGLNDMAESYGIGDDYGIRMLPGNEEFQYGPRPKSGPLGSWIQQVGTETVPGVTIAGRARTPERNREVGGVPDSLHITDNAVDFRPPPGMTQSELLSKFKSEFGSDFDVLPSKGRSVHVEPGPSILKGAPPAVAAQVAPTTQLGSMTPPPAGEAAPTSRASELQMMLEGYEGESVYADELASARKKATDEADAFKTMLEASLTNPEDAKASKAEMYFRLAAAFGSPTRTGGFGENLSLASKELADYSKGKRESARSNMATRMKLQEMRMGAAKEDLNALRTLSAEEMKDQRAIKQSLIKEYIDSGKPQSAAGKQALDEGYKAGTPEFQARVRELATLDIQRETAQIQALIGNLEINKRRDEREERKGEKLTPQELTLKRETEDSLASLNSALDLISKAYTLNPNTFDNSLVDQGRRKVLEISGAKDPKLINTRTLENLLKSQMITSAAEKMKGVLSDSDIKLLLDIQGLDAKSVEERAEILRSAYSVLKSGRTRLQQRLQDVSSGAYRQVSGE